MQVNKIVQRILKFLKLCRSAVSAPATYSYRVVEIFCDDTGEYTATVQVVGKQNVFHMKPEEILAKDSLTDLFSPRDIRTLTYLGYLGVEGPKYKILAQKLSENDDKLVFAVQKKGSKTIEAKTAEQIASDPEMLKSLNQKDAHTVGYMAGTQSVLSEAKQKEAARARLENDSKKAK